MQEFILILLLQTTTPRPAMITATFRTATRCAEAGKAAAEKFSVEPGVRQVTFVCVPK